MHEARYLKQPPHPDCLSPGTLKTAEIPTWGLKPNPYPQLHIPTERKMASLWWQWSLPRQSMNACLPCGYAPEKAPMDGGTIPRTKVCINRNATRNPIPLLHLVLYNSPVLKKLHIHYSLSLYATPHRFKPTVSFSLLLIVYRSEPFSGNSFHNADTHVLLTDPRGREFLSCRHWISKNNHFVVKLPSWKARNPFCCSLLEQIIYLYNNIYTKKKYIYI